MFFSYLHLQLQGQHVRIYFTHWIFPSLLNCCSQDVQSWYLRYYIIDVPGVLENNRAMLWVHTTVNMIIWRRLVWARRQISLFIWVVEEESYHNLNMNAKGKRSTVTYLKSWTVWRNCLLCLMWCVSQSIITKGHLGKRAVHLGDTGGVWTPRRFYSIHFCTVHQWWTYHVFQLIFSLVN